MDIPPIQYARTNDGVNIAYAVAGHGPVLIEMPQFGLGGLMCLSIPGYAEYYEALTRHCTVVCYDARGFGGSQRDEFEYTDATFASDLDAVTNDLDGDPFTLIGAFHSGPAAMHYAAAHRDTVQRLVLFQTYLDGAKYEAATPLVAMRQLLQRDMKTYITAAIGSARPPSAEAGRIAEQAWLESGSPQTALAWLNASGHLTAEDVVDQLPDVLVLHRRSSLIPPIALSQELAARIPHARLHVLTGDAFFPPWGDIPETVAAIVGFVAPGQAAPSSAGATTRTILFTDVEASSELTNRFGDAKARDILRQHEVLTREALSSHDGTEIKTMGDGFMASFTSASTALDAAIAMQQTITDHYARTETPISIRVGINAGEPIEEGHDLYGASVIRAARVMGQAQGGEILVSNVVRELVEGKGYLFSDRGEADLKGFDEAVRLFELRWQTALT